jgi:putative hydrolase of the HAD superfamily
MDLPMKTPVQRPSWILFDLGGVLADWTGPQALRALLPAPVADAEYARRWMNCAATDRFERGAIAPLDFARAFAADWQLALAPDDLLARYVGGLRGFYPGARELLAALRPQARLACLSNTNAAHWDSPVGQAIRAEFDVALASHELGLRKPQPEIFQQALHRLNARLNAAPSAVLYFDDLAPNVAAAKAAGLQAHHVAGLPALRARLLTLGLLPG